MPDELPLGFSYFGKGNGLPYCIEDKIVTTYRAGYDGDPLTGITALEDPPPEDGWPPDSLPNQVPIGDFDYLTLSQAFMLSYNVSSVKLSSTITLGGAGNETIITPTEVTFPSWGDMYALFQQSVEDFDESDVDPDSNNGLYTFEDGYGRTYIADPEFGEPFRVFVFDGCSSTASPSYNNVQQFFGGTEELANVDYYYHQFDANAGAYGQIVRIVDETTGLPIGDEGKTYVSFAETSINMGEDSNNYLGFLQVTVKAFDRGNYINRIEFTVDHPDGDFRLFGGVSYPTNSPLQDPAAENLTVNEISFREYS